jgi:hypothetical protein
MGGAANEVQWYLTLCAFLHGLRLLGAWNAAS